jgi:nucleoside-diphosphate-sugar epimerase
MTEEIHVVGASGRSGAVLCRALLAGGFGVVPVVRNADKWRGLGIGPAPVVADLGDGAALGRALGSAGVVVSCAHARHAGPILAAAVRAARFVFLGSTRRFTRWPDAHALGVLAGEAAFLGSGRAGVMLHPTMIYGAQGEDNVQRLAALLRRLPLVPLPGGGRALVQPIHQDDVTEAVIASLRVGWAGAETLVIAGAAAVSYAGFVRAVAAAAGQRRPRLVSVPGGLLRALAPLSLLPGLPRVRGAEIRRLLEDKAFDIGPMRARLGVDPVGLEAGLARLFGRG